MAAIPNSLPWHRRLEARVVAGVVLLIALSMSGILFATRRAVSTRSLERTSTDLEAARTAFYGLTNDRAEFAAAQSALITGLPVFRATMTDTQGDRATIEAMADGYRQQLKADFAIVADRNAVWMVQPGWPESAPPSIVGAVITSATAGRSSRDIVGYADRLYLVVSEPAKFADELLGTLTVGYALDDAVAKRLASVTHTDVNLVAGGRLYASSLPPADRAALTTAVASGAWPPAGASGTVQRVGNGQYAVGAFPLSADASMGSSGRIVLLEDWQPTQAFLENIQGQLLSAGAVIFVIAIAGGIVFSRQMTRPLQDLASAAEDIAGGNWTRQVPVRGSAEATMMARAVNEMTTGLRHWFEQVKTRDDQLRQAQKLEALGRLAGGVAHDFNNLLTAIHGYADLLIEELEPGSQKYADAQEIIKASERAASLTRQLLAFSRRQVIAVQVLALDRVVAGTEKMLRRLIGEDISFSTSIDGDAGFVKADPNQIEQILLNLVVNARDAMPTGGAINVNLANVELGSTHPRLAPGRYVSLSVADTGCGMSEEVKARIFEPFYTTKEEGRGTGLGLAMVYGIVQQMGGAIDVDTEVGRGTTFNILVPETTDAEPTEVDQTDRIAQRGTETVLLVEDEPIVKGLIASSLKKAGYNVLEATRGSEALQIAGAHSRPIDLLLADVVLPGMNGREVAERLLLTHRETRVLYMSGYAEDAILRHGVQTASTHFIQKPFTMQKLGAKIRETLASPLESFAMMQPDSPPDASAPS